MSERVTVTAPRTGPAGRRRRAAGPAAVPAAEVRELVRAQARIALATCAVVGLVVLGLPLLFAWVPDLSRVRVLGIRLPWLILCGAVQPVWIAAARRHVRLAERAEQDLTGPARR